MTELPDHAEKIKVALEGLAGYVGRLEAQRDRLRTLGDAMASQIERRWGCTPPCECSVCWSARQWRKYTDALEQERR